MNDITHVLGKTTDYKEYYNPDVLAREPRERNRTKYNLNSDSFHGYDVWHDYEASFLLTNGCTIQGILKFIVPVSSTYIVESKSLKLYLFSFMMERMGATKQEAVQNYVEVVKRDLEKLLETKIEIKFFDVESIEFASGNLLSWKNIDCTDVEVAEYVETPSLLVPSGSNNIRVCSHSLRSRCKITNQPDWGSIFIEMKGKDTPTEESLYKYIVSFRNENHFHEEIVEAVFSRLNNRFAPDYLLVTSFYTRRGGIDINPVRSLDEDIMSPFNIGDINNISYRMVRS